jgi:uncharacterized membrane protein YgcG
MKTLASGFALLLLAVPVYAQGTADPRWSRWAGCWDLVMENAREGAPSPDTAGRAPRTQLRDPARPQVCVEPSPDGGATFTTKVGTQTPIIQTVVADGKDRPITEDGCTGTQRAEWSADGLRLYARAELTCKGDQGTRRVSGLALLGPDGKWTDVQSVDIAGRESFRVRQYRRASDDLRAAPTLAATALTLDDVKEASAKVSPRALEAALVETRASFTLTSKRLLELQAAGVPASVVDLMVALSYPDRFVIERTASVDRAQAPIINDPFLLGWAFGYPVWSDIYGFYSPLYGAFSPYYYSPFAYPYLRGYNPYYFGGGYAIDVGSGGDGVGVPDRPSGQGRVVDGQGYTRVRPRESEPAVAVRPGGGSTASSTGSATSSSSGSSGGGSVSTAGFSSGGGTSSSGGGGDGGRTAQPR